LFSHLRYNKSFNRMGGTMRYVTADNRDFLLALARGAETGGDGCLSIDRIAGVV